MIGGTEKSFIVGVTAGMMFVVAFSNGWHVLKKADAAKSAHEREESPEKDILPWQKERKTEYL
jgi:hypothetical protein